MLPALAAPKSEKPVICQGESSGAHILMVGNCSFVGEPAGVVTKACRNDKVCRIEGLGRSNGKQVYIMIKVTSAQEVDPDAKTGLTTEELDMGAACADLQPGG